MGGIELKKVQALLNPEERRRLIIEKLEANLYKFGVSDEMTYFEIQKLGQHDPR